tara:strand:- start:8 stop:355 length:348 start_codon:yes stop_codon:yes gene_type:complete
MTNKTFLEQVQSIMQSRTNVISDPTLTDTSCDIWITEIERLVVTRIQPDDYMLVCYHYPHIDGPSTVVPVSDEPECIALQLASDVGEKALLEAVYHILDIPRATDLQYVIPKVSK